MALRHYDGPQGTFDYESKDWEMEYASIRWKGNNVVCNLPKGVKACDYMFTQLKLGEGFKFGDFDTSHVTNMSNMFRDVKFPRGCSLGEGFDTSRVDDMFEMFRGAFLPTGFSFGSKFKIFDDTITGSMFRGCTIMSGVVVPEMPKAYNSLAFGDAILSSSFLADNPWCTELSDARLDVMFYGATFYNEVTGRYEDFINYCKNSR